MHYTEEKIDDLLKEQRIIRLEPYINYTNKLLVRCEIDNYEWKLNIANFIHHNTGCPRCSKCEKWTNERIDKYLLDSKLPIKRLGNISSISKKIEWECLIDKNRWFTSFSKIIYRNQGCPQCFHKKVPIWNNTNIDNFLLKNNKIKRIGNYINNKTKIEWECLIDGKHWYAKPDAIILKNTKGQVTGCPECKRKDVLCNQKKKLSNEKIDKKLLDTNRQIKRIGDYTRNKDTPIEWECLIDGNRWVTSPGNILNGYKSGCPFCKNKSEKRIKELIINIVKYNKFSYQEIFKFNYRRYIVDFYLETLNNKRIIIEYNGRQHYFPVDMFGGQKQFEKQKLRDEQLRQYCKENDIYLFEIPFDMKDEDIITQLNIINNI